MKPEKKEKMLRILKKVCEVVVYLITGFTGGSIIG